MGHALNAFILKGSYDAAQADEFDLRRVTLPFDLTMFPTIDSYIDFWADRLDVHGYFELPLYNFMVIHHMMKAIAHDPLFAVIHTDYFGGIGEQGAGVYHGERVVLDPGGPGADINAALRVLGVVRARGKDEFDTVGLGEFRHSYDFFERDYDGPKRG